MTGDAQRSVTAEALTKTERVIARIGDDSGLALDPELDSYHLQDILVRQMPKLLSQLGDVWSLASASQPATPEGKTRLLTRAAIARTTSEELARSLTSAYRGNASGGLRRGTEATMAVMLSSVAAYLGGVDESLTNPDTFDRASLEPLWNSAAEDALTAWTGGLTDLRGLLDQRVDDLMGRLYWSLLIMGTLAGLSILLAFMTHRSIVRPLARLEDLANRVRSTKDYSHRVDYESKDEIGLARITPLPWLLAVTVASVQRLQGSNRTIPPVKFETFGARPRIPLDRCPAVTIALIYNSIS